MGITQVRNVREGELWNAPQFSIAVRVEELPATSRRSTATSKVGSGGPSDGRGRVGSLLRPLVLLVRGKELFPERRLPRRRKEGPFPARKMGRSSGGLTARTKTEERGRREQRSPHHSDGRFNSLNEDEREGDSTEGAREVWRVPKRGQSAKRSTFQMEISMHFYPIIQGG